MFQSVIHQSGVSAGRFGTGVWVSLFLHAGVFGALLGMSHQADPAPSKEHEIVIGPMRPPKGNPNPPAPKALEAAPKPKPKPKPKELVQPKNVKPLPAVEPKPVEPEATVEPVDPSLPYIPGSHPDGDPTDKAVPGLPYIAGLLPDGPPGGTGEDVMPFGAGMTPPKLLSAGVPLEYTEHARQAHVQGMVVIRCTITREGSVENCRVIKGQPFMDEAVVASLTSRRYAPLTFQGRTVNVSYTFNVNLRMP